MSLKETFFGKPPEKKSEMPERIQGRIYFLHKNGYGFIESEQIPQERIYFHWKSLNHDTKKFAELKRGDKVEFTPKKYDEKKGWQAQRVQVIV